MGRKKGSKNKQIEIAESTEAVETINISDAIDNLLNAELAKIEGMKEPGKSSAAFNLKRYYDAQRKSKQ